MTDAQKRIRNAWMWAMEWRCDWRDAARGWLGIYDGMRDRRGATGQPDCLAHPFPEIVS